MKQFSRFAIFLGSALCCLNPIHAAVISSPDQERTFLGPTLRLGYTSAINNNTAYSVAGEAAPKNFRVGATMGWLLAQNQRVKVSAEYLWQDITYNFLSGDTNQWVNQGAIGAAYQYDFDYCFNPQFDLNAYVSHAPNKTLGSRTLTLANADGTVTPYTLDRRIAGSNAVGVSPGITITPWLGGNLTAALNYDRVHYDRDYSTGNNPSGLGGTLALNQALTKRIGVGLGAEVRQPYNNYTADLSWTSIPDGGNWVVALFGNYLIGKDTLPDTWNLGLSANYLLDNRQLASSPVWRRSRDLKAEVPPPRNIRDNLTAWTAVPAVYMPQVLAVVDPRLTSQCPAANIPTLLSPIPDATRATGSAILVPTNIVPRSFNSPTHFAGNNLHYSLSVQVPQDPFCSVGNPSPPNDQIFSIDPNTGVVTATVFNNPNDCIWTLTINASNGCGTVSDTFDVQIDVNGGG